MCRISLSKRAAEVSHVAGKANQVGRMDGPESRLKYVIMIGLTNKRANALSPVPGRATRLMCSDQKIRVGLRATTQYNDQSRQMTTLTGSVDVERKATDSVTQGFVDGLSRPDCCSFLPGS
jgi:hypothetical protein